ncbi:MAG: DNA translocase FtsK 4TM domain-containing protein [Phycisphaerae bacterium]
MSVGRHADGRPLMWPIFLLAVCLSMWVSQLTFDAGDWPSTHRYPHNRITVNACGKAGAFTAYHVRRVLGDGVYPLMLFATCGALLWLMRGQVVKLAQRVFGLTLVVVCTSASVHLLSAPGPNTLEFGNGGLIGAAVAPLLIDAFAGVGTVLVLGYCFIVGLMFAAEGWMLRIFGAVKRAASLSGRAIAARMYLPAVAAGETGRVSRRTRPVADTIEEDPSRRGEPRLRFHGSREATRSRRRDHDEQPTLFDHAQRSKVKGPKAKGRGPSSSDFQPSTFDLQPSNMPCSLTAQETSEGDSPPQAPYPRPLESWKLPPVTMLDDADYTFTSAQESVLRAKAKTLERTLQEFRLDARVVEIDTGPVITMFELDLGAGIKVSQIAALANDIARALKAPAVRIIAPIPGKNTVGVEVPNTNKEKVRLKGMMFSSAKAIEEMGIPLLLGKDASGNTLVADLAAMPHMLIAGTTGSGKSVSLNAIIMSILMCRRPDVVKLILIDPKMVELSQFKDVPHLMAPIVTDTQRAEQILEWAVTKMDERYAMIAEARVRNTAAYNKLGERELYRRLQATTEQERMQIPARLPYIVIIIDELADLMMTAAREVEHHLSRLAQKSRAVGIHIVVATQRPEVKVVTGLIKSNLPCRCAFRVASRMDSRIVLDQNGAEVLMGEGDMLFLPPGSHKLVRAQGTYVEEHELQRVIEFLSSHGKPEFHPELVGMRAKNIGAGGERDPLFERAVEVILETGRGSVSLLQRRLTVGYSRASRLIEQMAAEGIVGAYKGSQAREVAITAEEWEQMRTADASDRVNDDSCETPGDDLQKKGSGVDF